MGYFDDVWETPNHPLKPRPIQKANEVDQEEMARVFSLPKEVPSAWNGIDRHDVNSIDESSMKMSAAFKAIERLEQFLEPQLPNHLSADQVVDKAMRKIQSLQEMLLEALMENKFGPDRLNP